MKLENSSKTTKNDIAFSIDKVRLPLIGVRDKVTIKELAVNTDKIICSFLMALVYFFVAIEEADYQVFSASNDFSKDDLKYTQMKDEWSIWSFFNR